MSHKLIDVVGAIADGRAIDWDSAEQHAEPGRPLRRLQALRTVAAIVCAHRTVQPTRADHPCSAPYSTATSLNQAIGTWGSYSLLDLLGSGSSADVYRAYDPKLDRHIALKLLTPFHSGPVAGDAVIAEGRHLARIRHRNIATVFAAERHNGRVGIAMELIEGLSLDQALLKNRTFTFVEVAKLGAQLCDALAAVHGAGLVHRDVKLQNVIIDNHDRLVLTDFGTATEVSSAGAWTLAGTPAYSAPETFHGREATAQSDLYSAAVVMFRLLTGVFPVAATSTAALRAAHLEQRGRRVGDLAPTVPSALASIIDRNLSPDPAARFSSAATMRDALLNFAHKTAVVTRPTPRTRSYRWPIAAVGLAAAVMGLLTFLARPGGAPTSSLPAVRANFILVASFDNRTGDADLDDAISYAIEDDLQRTRQVAMMPRFRIDDVLAQMRRPMESALDEALAREVSLRAGGVRAFVAGRVTKLGSHFTIAARLIDPQTGETLASLNESSRSKDELPHATRALAAKIVRQLSGVPPGGGGTALEPATTRSLRALALYTNSYYAGIRRQWPAALALARQAVAEDPEFATAQIWLAWSLRNTDASPEQYLPVAEHAVALSAHANSAERLWIEGSAHDMAGRHAEAERAYLALLQVEPDHYWAMNNMSSVFRLQNRFAELGALQRKRADRYPTDAAANLAAGNALIVVEADFDAARIYAERVRTFATDDRPLEKIWALTFNARERLARRDVDGMTREVNALLHAATALTPELHDELIDSAVMYLLTTGQVARAIAAMEQVHDRGRFYEYARASAAFVMKEDDVARRHIRRADPSRMPVRTALLMTRLGLFREAQQIMPSSNRSPIFSGNPVAAILTFARGDVDVAIPHLQSFYTRRAPGPHGPVSQVLAHAWLRKNDPGRAIAVLRDAFDTNLKGDAAATGPHGPLWIEPALMFIDLCRRHGCDADAAKAEGVLKELFVRADADFPPMRWLTNLENRPQAIIVK